MMCMLAKPYAHTSTFLPVFASSLLKYYMFALKASAVVLHTMNHYSGDIPHALSGLLPFYCFWLYKCSSMQKVNLG